MPRLTCIRKSGSSFSWTKASIYNARTKQTFTGSDADEAETKCLDGLTSARKSEKAGRLKLAQTQRGACSMLTKQAYAMAGLSCMRILNKY